MWIYQIQNTETSHSYIGQTKNAPKRRWNGHKSMLKKNQHFNVRLQEAWNLYGEEVFEFKLLKQFNTLNALNDGEIHFIEKLSPEYNLNSGGKNYKRLRPYPSVWPIERKLTRAKSTRKQKYPIKLRNPSGKIVSVRLLKEFCRNNNLDAGAITRLVKGLVKSHKGWTLPQTSQIKWQDRLSQSKRKASYPDIKSPDGMIFKIENLNKFSKEHNLNLASLHGVLRGTRTHTKGWRLA